jgi:hypothetical protein
VLVNFDIALEEMFGAPPLKSSVGMLKDRGETTAISKAIRSSYVEAIQ